MQVADEGMLAVLRCGLGAVGYRGGPTRYRYPAMEMHRCRRRGGWFGREGVQVSLESTLSRRGLGGVGASEMRARGDGWVAR